jgi:hypothetical protein
MTFDETQHNRVAHVDFDAVLGPAAAKDAEGIFVEFLQYVDERLPSSQGWLFGLPDPSAADAHLVALLVRMDDVGRGGLITGKVREYADRAKESPEWQSVMGTYTTTMSPG